MAAATPLHVHNPNCHVCGADNPCFGEVRFRREGDRVHAELHLDHRHEGAPGFVHGGVLAAVLDDTLGALLWVLERPAVTARLEVDYRRPAFTGQDHTAEAWCEGTEGRKLHLLAVVRNAAGEVVAEARSLFVEVPREHFAKGGGELPW